MKFFSPRSLILFLAILAAFFISSSSSIAPEAIQQDVAIKQEERVLHADSLQATTDAPTLAPTVVPTSRKPTQRPTRRPTRRPTERKSIYGDFTPEKMLDYSEQQDVVIVLIIAIFVYLAFEIAAPEVVMLIALMIVIFCEVLTLTEGLAGKFPIS